MINFNNAPEQRDAVSRGPIPAKSMVKVRMEIRSNPSKASNINPLLTISAKNNKNHYLDCEFEVVSGSYAGIKMWNIYVVVGSDKACNISMAFLRGVLESARGIHPGDGSQNATNARQLNDWSEFNGMEFVAMIDIKKVQPGDEYINNTISKAITPDKDEYQEIMSGGEIITDNPIPELIPAVNHGIEYATPQTQKKPAAQQNTGYQPPQQQNQQAPPQQQNQQAPQGYQPPQQNEGNGMDTPMNHPPRTQQQFVSQSGQSPPPENKPGPDYIVPDDPTTPKWAI